MNREIGHGTASRQLQQHSGSHSASRHGGRAVVGTDEYAQAAGAEARGYDALFHVVAAEHAWWRLARPRRPGHTDGAATR
jgi:hypothetical protein